MSVKIDKGFAVLLLLSALGHLVGTFKFFEIGSPIFVWSLSGALAAALLSVLNFMRADRKQDRGLAWVTTFGTLGWLAIVLLFGRTIGNLVDPRVLMHAVAAVGLIFFSVKSLRA